MEQKIIALLQAQKEEAISLLYDNYSAILYGVVLRIVRSPDVAQDVLQETFVKVWRHGGTYDATKGKLMTWLLNIARHTAIDVLRSSNWKMSKETVDLTGLNDFGKEDINPEHIGLKELANSLDPKYRVLIDLIYFQGYTHQEIEKELNMPLGTVKTRLRMAIVNLRKAFGERADNVMSNNS